MKRLIFLPIILLFLAACEKDYRTGSGGGGAWVDNGPYMPDSVVRKFEVFRRDSIFPIKQKPFDVEFGFDYYPKAPYFFDNPGGEQERLRLIWKDIFYEIFPKDLDRALLSKYKFKIIVHYKDKNLPYILTWQLFMFTI